MSDERNPPPNPYRVPTPGGQPGGLSGPGGAADPDLTQRELDFAGIFARSLRLLMRNPLDFVFPAVIAAAGITAATYFGYQSAIDEMRFFFQDVLAWTAELEEAEAARAEDGESREGQSGPGGPSDSEAPPEELPPEFDRFFASLFQFLRSILPELAVMTAAQVGLIGLMNLYLSIRGAQLLGALQGGAPEALGRTLQHAPLYAIAGFLAWLLIAIGSLFCYLPGLALMVLLGFLPALVGVDQRGFASLSESFRIWTWPRFLKALGVYALLYIGLYTIGLFITTPLSMLGPGGQPPAPGEMPDLDAQLEAMRSPAILWQIGPSSLVMTLAYAALNAAGIVMYLNFTRALKPQPGAPGGRSGDAADRSDRFGGSSGGAQSPYGGPGGSSPYGGGSGSPYGGDSGSSGGGTRSPYS